MAYPDLTHRTAAQLTPAETKQLPLTKQELRERNARIYAAWDADLPIRAIAFLLRMSEIAIEVILHQRERNRRDNGRAPSCRYVEMAPEVGNFTQRLSISSMAMGSRQLLKAILLYHLRSATLPPGWSPGKFFETLARLGVSAHYQPPATITVATN